MATHSFTSKSSSATPLCSCWSRPTTIPLPLLAAVFRPPRGGLRRDRPRDRAPPRSKSKRRRPLAGGRHCHRASCCHYFKLPPAEQETEVGESGTPRGFSGGVGGASNTNRLSRTGRVPLTWRNVESHLGIGCVFDCAPRRRAIVKRGHGDLRNAMARIV